MSSHLEEDNLGSVDWSRRVANPEGLGPREKKLWSDIEPVIHRVLDELKRNGVIETVFVQKEIDALWSCIVKQDVFSKVSNVLLHISDSEEKAAEFVKLNARFGLDEHTVVADYILSALSLSILKTELFKLVLLFNLKRGGKLSHAVSKFSSTMDGVAPKTWPELKPFVDNPLRNALAHATYALADDKVVLFDDATLEPIEELDLGHIMMRAKDQDVLFQCLLNILDDRAKHGFFRT
jgi:hypothetical protein